MSVQDELGALRLVGDSPTWIHLVRLGGNPNLEVRQAAIHAAGRAVDAPASVLQVIAEVALLSNGRATSWTPRFHRLRRSGNDIPFVADVLQQAATTPVPFLVDLMTHQDMRWVAEQCVSHQSRSARAIARAIMAGVVPEKAVEVAQPHLVRQAPPPGADEHAGVGAARMVW